MVRPGCIHNSGRGQTASIEVLGEEHVGNENWMVAIELSVLHIIEIWQKIKLNDLEHWGYYPLIGYMHLPFGPIQTPSHMCR